MRRPDKPLAPWQERLHEIIFEADTPAGKAFDVVLLVAIVASVGCVMLETLPSIEPDQKRLLRVAERVFTALFSVEYILRIICVQRPLRYIFSFYGLVDLLSIMPTYLSVFIPGSESLLVIRALRLLRVFRVFKLARFLSEAKALRHALWQARAKVIVFLVTVLIVVTIMGSAMYLVEGPNVQRGLRLDSPFSSIPESVYWAVVTMTTVGYGDITPQTPLGKLITLVVTVLGYSLIIVPTGIITAEITGQGRAHPPTTQACPACTKHGHDPDAEFCKFCGANL